MSCADYIGTCEAPHLCRVIQSRRKFPRALFSMKVKAFPSLVPAPGKAETVASVPYDVVNTQEARALAGDNPHSFLRVVRAEIDFPDGTDPYGDEIYAKSKSNLDAAGKRDSHARARTLRVSLSQIMNAFPRSGSPWPATLRITKTTSSANTRKLAR